MQFEKMFMVSKGSRGRACVGGLRSNLGSDFQNGRIRKNCLKNCMFSLGSRGRACFGGLRSTLGSDFQRGRIRKEVV